MEIPNIPYMDENLETVSVSFYCCDKIPNKSNLVKDRLTLTRDLRVQPIMAGE